MTELMFNLPTAKFKNEAAFTTWFWKRIKDWGGFFHKISDYSLWYKPFDAIMAYQGIVAAIEFKYANTLTCIPFTMLRGSCQSKPWSQVEGLHKYSDNGWKSLIIIYSAKKHSYVIVDFEWPDLHTKLIFNG